jgi:CBS domain containing-hemolysin-like protein
VDVSHEDGVIESEEREMIYNVFDFSDALAKDIMIPRINMVTVSVDDSYDEVLSVFRESMYTRLPVYQDDKDNIIGLINIKDFILSDNAGAFNVRNILRDAHYTYEIKKIADLMYELREKTMNVAFVLNEYGATVGMITLEDLLEEIVGEIRDEYDDDEEELIQAVDDNSYLVEGSMKLDDINDALGTNLDSEDYDSIGGIIIEQLDRLPEDNEEVTLENGVKLKVQGIDQNRIIKVLMILPENIGNAELSETEETASAEETAN